MELIDQSIGFYCKPNHHSKGHINVTLAKSNPIDGAHKIRIVPDQLMKSLPKNLMQ